MVVTGLNSLYFNSFSLSHSLLLAGGGFASDYGQSSLRVFLSSICAKQSRLLWSVYGYCCRFVGGFAPADGMSDGAGSIVSFSDLFEQVCTVLSPQQWATNMDSCEEDALLALVPPQVSLYGDGGQLVPLVASCVSLPDSVSGVPLLSLLPEKAVALYGSPDGGLLLESPRCSRVHPKVHCTSPEEWRKIVLLLRSLCMVDLVDGSRVKCVNGAFGVSKGDGKIRFICDGRPANSRFVESPYVRLPSPSDLASLFVPGDGSATPLYVAKIDLSNFYHHLRMPEWLCSYFCLPPLVIDGAMVYPRLLTLPMGFSHAVYLAQLVNEHVLYSSPSAPLSPEGNLLNLVSPFLGSGMVHSTYIDDLGMMSTVRDTVASAYRACIDRYAQCGLVVNVKKSVEPTCDGVELWGVVIGAGGGAVSPSKLMKLAHCTVRLLSAGVATGLQVSAVVSSWTWAMLLRRPALAVFSAVYRFIQVAQRRKFELWPSVRTELLNAVLMAPLYAFEFGSTFHQKVVATDASLFGAGMVTAPLTAEMFGCCWPLSTDKHGLLAPYGEVDARRAVGVRQPALDVDFPPLPEVRHVERTLAAVERWSTVLSYPFRYSSVYAPDTIAVLEFRALLSAVKWMMSVPSCARSRVLALTDNSNVYYAMRKGRVSSYSLLRVQRKVNALLLASGIGVLPCWVPSALNPADGPSRAFDPA